MTYPTEAEARVLVVEAGHKLLEKHLAERTWGNISMRIGDDEFIITPSGRSYEEMKAEDLPVVSLRDLSWKGPYKPSSEKGMHGEVYKVRPDALCIIHTHQDAASIVSVRDSDFGEYPSASYAMSSTSALAISVSKVFASHIDSKAVLMPHHGAVCIGRTLDEAFAEADRLEEKASAEVQRVIGNITGEAVDYGRSRRTESGFSFTIDGRTHECTLSETIFPLSMHADIYRHYESINFIAGGTTTAEAAVSSMKKTVHPSIDDLAMIAGSTIRFSETSRVVSALKGRNAVFVPGGVIAVSEEADDLEALLSLLEKGSAAELYRSKINGCTVPRLSALIERFVYVKKYSKNKR